MMSELSMQTSRGWGRDRIDLIWHGPFAFLAQCEIMALSLTAYIEVSLRADCSLDTVMS